LVDYEVTYLDSWLVGRLVS